MMRDQSKLIGGVDWDWLIIFDGARYDLFDECTQYDPVCAHNGGETYTATWFWRHFSGQYDCPMFHGGQPIYSFDRNPHDYDERDHFERVPSYELYPWGATMSGTVTPGDLATVVKANADADEGGVIRCLQPHNPYRSLPIHDVHDALTYSDEELRAAYKDTLSWGVETIRDDLLGWLDGQVVMTSDHGQCLGDCGQYLHDLNWDNHEHLVRVPWVSL